MNSRKRVEMVNSMKEQAEIIKAQYNNPDFGIGKLIESPLVKTDSGLDKNPCEDPDIAGNNIFYFGYGENNGLEKKFEKKQSPDAENTVWVQYKPNADSDPVYYDFYIRACWQTVGSIQNTDSSQFILRLNTITGAVTTPPPSDTITENSGITTLAFEDSRPLVDRDYNDYVVNMEVSEIYKNDYLDKITIKYTPKIRDACFDHHLFLVFNGIVVGGSNNTGPKGSKSVQSAEMFSGNATISSVVTKNGVAGGSSNTAKSSNLDIFPDGTAQTLDSNSNYLQTTEVTITGFEQSAANTKAVRGDFNIKRYRTYLRVAAQNVVNATCNISTLADDIDLVDINLNMFDNNASNPYPLAFFVPANWTWPSSGQNIDLKYPNFKYHAQYLNALRTNQNAVEDQRGTSWYN